MSLDTFRSLKSNTPETRLAELGIELPPKRTPMGNYTGAVTTGKLVFVAGHRTFRGPEQTHKSKLGAAISVQTGQEAPRIPPLSALTSPQDDVAGLAPRHLIARPYGLGATTNHAQHPP